MTHPTSSKPPLFVTQVDLSLAEKLVGDLTSQGFEITKPPYTRFSAKKKGISCTLYESGKLVVQGKETSAFLEFYLEPEILGTFAYSYADLQLDQTSRIGIDESGKGDFFGPLCIAGLYAEKEAIVLLQKLGVKDSKTLSDATILKKGQEIRKHCVFHVVRINPPKYNELYQKFHNLNRLLAWGHATVIETLVKKTGCRKVMIDQFAAEEVVESALARKALQVDLTQRHRGEEDLVVAGASILARQEFLLGLQNLKEKFGMTLPKGASSQVLAAGEKFVQQHGKEKLGEVGKLHFKTLEQILKEDF